MKKVIKFFFFFLCLIFVGTMFAGCDGKSLQEGISGKISEFREDFFYGSLDNVSASFTDGRRESNFRADGKSTELQDFGVLLVRANESEDTLDFVLKINDLEYEGTLQKNPFDKSYVIDLNRRVESTDKITLSLPSLNLSFDLECLSKDWAVDSNKALNIFTHNNKANLNEYFVDGNFNGEVFIKIVADKGNIANIYWYVLCVCEDGNIFANLISVDNGEILQN